LEKDNRKEKQHVRGKHARCMHAGKPNYVRVRFLKETVTRRPKKLRITINMCLGGLGQGSVI
jgi:hypothetical protein